MANEYKLSYTGSEIDEKLAKIDELDTKSTATNLVNGSKRGSLRSVDTADEGGEHTIEGHTFTYVMGKYAFAEGKDSIAFGDSSHAEGENTSALSDSAHAEGENSIAIGKNSHAEGEKTIARGESSHVEGYKTEAIGKNSHAEGNQTIASGIYSHAEGKGTEASGICSHAEGKGTIANGGEQHVQGRYNIASQDYAHIVGNGDDDNELSNAHTLDWDGNAWFSGDVYVGSTSGTNKDEGSKKLATVDEMNAAIAAAIEAAFADIARAEEVSF